MGSGPAWPGRTDFQGLVAGVPLDRGAAAVNASLQRLSHEPGVAGVRQLIQDENEGFALQPQFVDAVQLVGQLGLTVDLCVRNHQIAEVTKLAELCPEGTFVLNHLGKPDVAAGQWTGWLHDIKAMAHLDNVRCKLSGLTTEAGEGTRGTNKIRRYLRAVVDAFGPDRCMFGSDWPNASLHIPVRRVGVPRPRLCVGPRRAREESSHARHGAGGLRTGLGVQMKTNRPAAAGRACVGHRAMPWGYAFSSGLEAALTGVRISDAIRQLGDPRHPISHLRWPARVRCHEPGAGLLRGLRGHHDGCRRRA